MWIQHRIGEFGLQVRLPIFKSEFLLMSAKSVLLVVAIPVAIFIGWQIGSCELSKYELQDDMKDLSSQLGAKIGLVQASSVSDIQRQVISRADRYEIELAPQQIQVDRSGPPEAPEIYIRAEYDAPVNLLVYSFSMHFTLEASNVKR